MESESLSVDQNRMTTNVGGTLVVLACIAAGIRRTNAVINILILIVIIISVVVVVVVVVVIGVVLVVVEGNCQGYNYSDIIKFASQKIPFFESKSQYRLSNGTYTCCLRRLLLGFPSNSRCQCVGNNNMAVREEIRSMDKPVDKGYNISLMYIVPQSISCYNVYKWMI